ncbi:MAG: ATP-binding protein, partial [Lachnospiraceae bacterium]|nr:ATP-binding protein [Lachnospiraceae bacterium]
MNYNLIVENYGKIKSANISKKPLTLLVGDNNTGKSYLLSLIWALDSLESDSKLLEKIKNSEASEAYLKIKRKLCDYIQNTQLDSDLELMLGKEELETLTNEFMRNNKNKFVSNIFNDKNVEIGTLKIELEEGIFTNIVYEGKLEGIVRYAWDDNRRSVGVENLEDVGVEAFAVFFIRRIVIWVLSKSDEKTVYLPAARTGFMLAKDVINKVGRQETFDVMGQKIGNQVSLQAFTKPIIGFLNTIEELSFDVGEKYEEIVEYIEKDIIHGEVKYSNLGKREIRYV